MARPDRSGQRIGLCRFLRMLDGVDHLVGRPYRIRHETEVGHRGLVAVVFLDLGCRRRVLHDCDFETLL